jgi:predicted nucleic acid-binding protein
LADRIVVADTSPLIGLAAADAFDLLRRLFGHVVITAAVRDEVMAAPQLPGAAEVERALADGWLNVAQASDDSTAFPDLGPGEASTIAWALEREGPCLVVLDDSAARIRARDHGLTVVGVLGILVAAKRAGHIDRLEPKERRLAASGFRIAPKLVDEVLRESGEI